MLRRAAIAISPVLTPALTLLITLVTSLSAQASATTSVREYDRVFASFKYGSPVSPLSAVSASSANPSENLKLEAGRGFFVSSPQSSCTDLVEAKATKSTAKTSVEAQGFALESLTLDWSSTDILNVDSIRAVITDGSGNRAVLELPGEEVLALLGHEQAALQGPVKVTTNDPARAADPKFVPCGVSFGGINWLNQAADLKVVLSVIGSSESASGHLEPVEVSIETTITP